MLTPLSVVCSAELALDRLWPSSGVIIILGKKQSPVMFDHLITFTDDAC